MSVTDYYELLGVSREASEEEIKRAYRRLIKKYHPDTHGDDPAAEDMMKRINEAYECLSDRNRRAAYDRFGSAAAAAEHMPARGEDISVGAELSFGDACRGRKINIKYSRREICPHEGEGVCTRCLGSGYIRADKNINVTVPAGIADGQVMQLSGMGGAGRNGGGYGDLLIKISVGESPVFTRSGSDLYADVPVTFAKAALGGMIPIPTLEGAEEYGISAGTQHGTLYRLEGRGIKLIGGGRGDLYIRVCVQIPENLSLAQREAVKNAEAAMKENNYPEIREYNKNIK